MTIGLWSTAVFVGEQSFGLRKVLPKQVLDNIHNTIKTNTYAYRPLYRQHVRIQTTSKRNFESVWLVQFKETEYDVSGAIYKESQWPLMQTVVIDLLKGLCLCCKSCYVRHQLLLLHSATPRIKLSWEVANSGEWQIDSSFSIIKKIEDRSLGQWRHSGLQVDLWSKWTWPSNKRNVASVLRIHTSIVNTVRHDCRAFLNPAQLQFQPNTAIVPTQHGYSSSN